MLPSTSFRQTWYDQSTMLPNNFDMQNQKNYVPGSPKNCGGAKAFLALHFFSFKAQLVSVAREKKSRRKFVHSEHNS